MSSASVKLPSMRYAIDRSSGRSSSNGGSLPGSRVPLAGRPALAGYADGAPFSVITFDFAGNRIRGVFILNDPEKLGHLPPLQEN